MDQLCLFFYPFTIIWLQDLVSVLFGKRDSGFVCRRLTFLITLGVFSPFFSAKGYYAIGLYPCCWFFGVGLDCDFLVGFKSIYGEAIAQISLLALPPLLFLPALPLIHPLFP